MVSTLQFFVKFPFMSGVTNTRLAVFVSLLAIAPLFATAPVFADHTKKNQLSPSELQAARELDWVPIEELTEEQKKNVPAACCGAFVAPARFDADASLDPHSAPLHATADESESENQSRVTLNGKVIITQGNRSILADKAHMDQDTHEAKMNGGLQLREPGVLMRADNAEMNMQTDEIRLDNTRFVLYESRVHGDAEHMHKFGDNVINLEKSKISSCEPGDNSWSIQGSEITLYPDLHYGVAENMRLNIKDVPVAYMPYVRFPVGNERLSGFLFPSVGYSSNRHQLDISAPFYWNIAPDYDATISPRYITGRGSMIEAEARDLTKHLETKVSGSYIANDHGGYNTDDTPVDSDGTDRWFYNLDQTGGKGEAWSSSINYSDLSDNNYLRDLNYGSVDANRQAYIRQTATIDYRTNHWFMGAKADEYRLLTSVQTLPYRELPRVHFDGDYRFGDWSFKLNNEYVHFVKNRYFDLPTDNIIFGERTDTDYSLTWDKRVAWGFLKPSAAVKTMSYQLDYQKSGDELQGSPSFAVPQASLDTGLYFERDTDLLGGSYVQTLEPRLFYFYSQYKNQNSLYHLTDNNSFVNFDTSDLTFNYDQLFRTTRFAGGDRLDDANQVSLAVSSAFISQATGVERLRMSIGQIFYANDRKITVYDPSSVTDAQLLSDNTRSSSDLAAQISGQINQRLRLTADAAYDQRSDKLDNASTGIHYMDDAYRLLNITYRYTLRPVSINPSQPVPTFTGALNQIDASAVWPVNSTWSVIARSNYDFKYNVELDTFIGLEYDDCCYRIRLMGRHWLDAIYNNSKSLENIKHDDYQTGIMFELQLKGLASTSQKISSLLDKAVTGFTEREKHLR